MRKFLNGTILRHQSSYHFGDFWIGRDIGLAEIVRKNLTKVTNAIDIHIFMLLKLVDANEN